MKDEYDMNQYYYNRDGSATMDPMHQQQQQQQQQQHMHRDQNFHGFINNQQYNMHSNVSGN